MLPSQSKKKRKKSSQFFELSQKSQDITPQNEVHIQLKRKSRQKDSNLLEFSEFSMDKTPRNAEETEQIQQQHKDQQENGKKVSAFFELSQRKSEDNQHLLSENHTFLQVDNSPVSPSNSNRRRSTQLKSPANKQQRQRQKQRPFQLTYENLSPKNDLPDNNNNSNLSPNSDVGYQQGDGDSKKREFFNQQPQIKIQSIKSEEDIGEGNLDKRGSEQGNLELYHMKRKKKGGNKLMKQASKRHSFQGGALQDEENKGKFGDIQGIITTQQIKKPGIAKIHSQEDVEDVEKQDKKQDDQQDKEKEKEKKEKTESDSEDSHFTEEEEIYIENFEEIKKDPKIKFGQTTLKQEIREERYRTVPEALFRLHSLFGIFLVFDKELSRPKRFILYYLQLHLLLALTALFSQNMDQIQSLVFSLISAIMLGLPMAILKAMFKKESKIVNIIGVLLFVGLYLTCVYSILTIAALMGVDKSNEWAVSYFTTYSVDTFMFESFGNFAKIYLIRSEIMGGSRYLLQKFIGNKDLVKYIKGH